MDIRSNKIILFNPRSATRNHRLPISILQVGASVYGKYDIVFIDGNLENNPLDKITLYLKTGEFKFFASTVMPGPQLKQAINVTKTVKENFPEVITIWGGYFASNHTELSMKSGYIDYIIRGAGDIAFPELIEHLINQHGHQLSQITNLAFKDPSGKLIINPLSVIPDQDNLPLLPLKHLENFYSIERYIVKTFIGNRTFLYHSSMGCPHICAFCGVNSIYNGAWKGKSAKKMFGEIIEYKNNYRIDSLEIIDSNFFASKKRVLDFCTLMTGQQIRWWAEGRVDTLNYYTDTELKLLKASGCHLIFIGAETGNDTVLKEINKGGTVTAQLTRELVKRLLKSSIIPQLSFVLGFPSKDLKTVHQNVRADINFIRQLKKINPTTEFILFLYSPVPVHESGLFKSSLDNGFSFPGLLEEWLKPEWENFDLRRGQITPWLSEKTVKYIQNFEAVLNASSPNISNFQISRPGKAFLQFFGRIRYTLKWYKFPYELKILLKLFSYQRPEKEGFYSE
jgi:radical SAM superfamily enzyme YgiQ (UPF0313 family)